MTSSKIMQLTGTSIFLFSTFLIFSFSTPKESTNQISGITSNDPTQEILDKNIERRQVAVASVNPIDVPLEDQNGGDIPLENGCEITSLSMLLQFHGYSVDKNQLADILDYVPLILNEEDDEEDWYFGNPHEGFVGDIDGGYDAMGVAIEPIEKVAEKIVQGKQKIKGTSDLLFSEIETQIKNGNPVFVITTVDFVVPTEDDWITWDTTSGPIEVTPLCHAAVVTGITVDTVYVNDPFGEKDRSVPRQQFEEAYRQMGSQGLYIN